MAIREHFESVGKRFKSWQLSFKAFPAFLRTHLFAFGYPMEFVPVPIDLRLRRI